MTPAQYREAGKELSVLTTPLDTFAQMCLSQDTEDILRSVVREMGFKSYVRPVEESDHDDIVSYAIEACEYLGCEHKHRTVPGSLRYPVDGSMCLDCRLMFDGRSWLPIETVLDRIKKVRL